MYFTCYSVTVSLVTIKGTDCKTTELGQVADTTGGQVTEEFCIKCCYNDASVKVVCMCMFTYCHPSTLH